MTLGLGRAVARPDPDQRPVRAATPTRSSDAIAADRAAGRRPIAIVATIGTTSSTSVDPVAAIADIAAREGLWLHVDAAYAGAVAIAPGARGAVRGLGARRLDRRQPAQVAVHAARRVAAASPAGWTSCGPRSASCPSTCGRSTARRPVRDYNEYTPQLGRRFRALKLWMQLRWFGLEGLRRRIRAPPRRWRSAFAGWVDAAPGLGAARAGPVLDGLLPPRARRRSAGDEAAARRPQRAVMDAVNRTGEVFLSHTRLRGRFTIRLAIGNLRTERAPRRAGVGAAPRAAADRRRYDAR